MLVRLRRAARLLAVGRERSILPIMMIGQDLYIRIAYRRLWKAAGL